MEKGTIAASITCLSLLSVLTTLIINDYDRVKNKAIEQEATKDMILTMSYGKKVDPLVAYKVDTMRRLNEKGAWLTQKEVKEVMDIQFADYMKTLPDDRKNWTSDQRQIFDYAFSTIVAFEKFPDKEGFRERIRQDLKNANKPVTVVSEIFKEKYSQTTRLQNTRQD